MPPKGAEVQKRGTMKPQVSAINQQTFRKMSLPSPLKPSKRPGHIARETFSALIYFFFFTFMSAPLSSQNLPQAPGIKVLDLTPTPGPFTEPSIAVNPNHPGQVVAVFQDNAHASYSQDAGRTWHGAEGVAPQNYRVSGDVSTVYDNQGHAFICYIAFDKLGTFNYWAHNASRNGIFVRRSLDGGKTWESKDVAVSEFATVPAIPFEDKPYLVSDATQSRYAGNLYVGWTRWTLSGSEILLSRSTDDGQSWSKPVEIDRHAGLPRDDNGAAEGFEGTVGPDGRLYAIWSQGDDIMLTTSNDGGKTFSRAQSIIHTAPIMFAVETLERANGFPQIGIDLRSRRLFVTWTDYRNGDLDVFCSTSRDGGKKWSAPVRVNDDLIHDGADQFFQWLAVDPIDGTANVLFYDRRGDPQNRKQTVTLARSTDGGSTFQNYAWTTQPFEAGGVFFGDYSGIAAFGGRVYGVWTEKPPLIPETNPAKDTNDARAAAPSDKNSAEKAPNQGSATPPKRFGTVVRVGVADFNPPPIGTPQ